MVRRTSDWRDELGRWLKPFLDRLGHKARRQMCPLYVSGLIGPGDRKSIQPMAKRLALGECDQLHHFIAAGVWDATPAETELLIQADRRCAHFSFLGLLRGLDCRGSSLLLAGFLLGGAPLEGRGPIPKLLRYLAATSLRTTKVEPVQTYSWEL
jgi:hypothetical protein